MGEFYIGQIVPFAGNFAIRGWAQCDGQLLSISQNTALFSILGTTYGGNGQTNFALPDLRGAFAMHYGAGPGRTPRSLGETGGQETVTLTSNQMPAHNHAVPAFSQPGTSRSNAGQFLSNVSQGYNATSDGTALQPVQTVGGSQPHDNMPPFLAINFLICIEGLFPPRN